MSKMFDILDDALSEALEYVKGNVKLRAKEVFIPNSPKTYSASDIKKLRRKLNFSQKEFASWLNVSLNTVESWEQGVRTPNHAALRLLEIFDKGFSSVKKICKSNDDIHKKGSKKEFPIPSVGRSPKVAIAAKTKH